MMFLQRGLFQGDVLRAKLLLGERGAPQKADMQHSNGVSVSTRRDGKLLEYLYPKQKFLFAGVPYSNRKKFLRLLTLVIIAALSGAMATGMAAFFSAPFLLYFLQNRILESRCEKRQANFDKDYAALLLSLSSGLKTGLDPLVALCRAAELFQSDSVLREELKSFERALEEGETEDEAIDSFGYTVRHPDVKLFRMAFKLARKEGASLALCLQRLARVTRQRQSFRRKTRGAVAMQKLSAFAIAGCTILIGIIQFGSNPTAFMDTFMNPLGRGVLLFGLGLIAIGIGWMLRMSKLKV